MGIAFDDGAADALITAANSADEVLRAEGGFRQTSHPRTLTMKPSHLLAMSALTVLLLTGCTPVTGQNPPSSTSGVPAVTPEKARAELIDLIASVEAIIPGQWERDKIPYGESCSLRGGAEGTHYYGDSLGPKASLDEKYAAQEKVKTLLESRAYRVEVTHDPGEGHVMRTVGFGPNKITIIYTTGDLQNVVGGQSQCVPDPEGKYR